MQENKFARWKSSWKDFCGGDFMKQEQEKIIHLTSDKDKKVAEVSKKIFERNREAYRILANKWKIM